MKTLRHLFASFSLILMSAPAALADTGGGTQGYGFGDHMHDGDMHGYWMGPLMMIAFVIVAVVAVVLIVRWIGGDKHSSGPAAQGGSAADILRERYARGEIDDDEFARRMATLSKHS